uniref:Ig-like domain-containing protein n=1 Tax=Poecilia reticulata TaxID=8081 RepID=A0A3P9MYE4_POERE
VYKLFFKYLFPLPDQYKLVGHEPILAKVGDDVILPCHVEPPFDVNDLTIEWRFKGKKIYVHRSQKRDDTTSDPEYKNRTFMVHKNLTHGDISLSLTNLVKEDDGNYTCLVPKLESQVKKRNTPEPLADQIIGSMAATLWKKHYAVIAQLSIYIGQMQGQSKAK